MPMREMHDVHGDETMAMKSEDEARSSLLPKRLSGGALKSEEEPLHPATPAAYPGLTTRHALTLFTKLIEEEQAEYYRSLRWQGWLKDALHHNSGRSIFNWTEGMCLFLQLILACAAYASQPESDRIYIRRSEFTALVFVLVGSGIVNICLACAEARSRHLELWRQVVALLRTLRDELRRPVLEWKPSSYPDLLLPDSPCVALQWTYRDKNLVSLPATLLVPGDIILVRPSQKVLCHCAAIEEGNEFSKGLVLLPGDVFQPDTEGELEAPVAPTLRTAAGDARFRVIEAPFKKLLMECLSRKPLQRPSSVIEKQRMTTMGYIIRRLLPCVLALFVVGNIVEASVFWETYKLRWVEEFIYGSLYVILPLSPLIFPSLWLGVNYIILARVLSVFHKFKKKRFKHEHLHEAKLTDAIYIVKADWESTWKRFRSFVKGTNDSLYQTSNIVHTLGNVTAVCCMDKKGILSWPNPNAEKVCVLRARGESATASKISLRQSSNSLQEVMHTSEETVSAKAFERHNSLSVVHHEVLSIPEVVDITQSGGREFEVEFDDKSWTSLLGSLKPLGLAVLLNTCNKDVQEYYRSFTDHVSCVALHHDQTVPVVNRRCLCSLSGLIGFKSDALSIFKHVQHMAFYRKPAKTPRELEGRYKSPFPNMLSIIGQDIKSGTLQVMSQGTADLVLDTCTDYWNGQETHPLNEEDRKHILEFYTRFSMTAYCTAFAYSPITATVPDAASDSDSDDEDTFVELPSETEDASLHELTSQISDSSNGLVKDLYDSCCKNQVFLGCVAQQYQSRNEFVHLIDLLEQACIRFIHFSPETELRSRVFAERLGLESGWNCHISLDSKGIDPTALDPESVHPVEDTQAGKKVAIVVEPEINLENRARLPRGIENMREHIRDVDNVPLLVSLFTDCQPESIKEMIGIMQENGEVVCCLGSSGNLSNCSVFLQADASIGIEPMYPKICCSTSSGPVVDKKHTRLLPTELMKTLTTLTCSLSCQKEDPLSLMQLVIESRHNLAVLRNCFKYLISAGLFLVILHTIANFMCIPPSLSLGHILLLSCFSIPLLSLALLSAPHDRNLMRISTGKNRSDDIVNRDSTFRFLRTFLLRWLPSVLIVLLCQTLLLSESCVHGELTCYPVIPRLLRPAQAVSLSQNFCALLTIIYFDVISLGYGNTKPGFWKYSPMKNLFWMLAVITGLFVQLMYFFCDTAFPVVRFTTAVNSTVDGEIGHFLREEEGLYSRVERDDVHWFDVPLWVWLVGFLWPLLLLPVNELIKKFELAELDKQQKRARLQFGTKLGMNSPF